MVLFTFTQTRAGGDHVGHNNDNSELSFF